MEKKVLTPEKITDWMRFNPTSYFAELAKLIRDYGDEKQKLGKLEGYEVGYDDGYDDGYDARAQEDYWE